LQNYIKNAIVRNSSAVGVKALAEVFADNLNSKIRFLKLDILNPWKALSHLKSKMEGLPPVRLLFSSIEEI